MSQNPRLSLKSVGWTVGDRSILSRVDLEVLAGECLAVVGPNGAGKTSLLRIAAGLLEPTHGELLWENTPYPKWTRRALAKRIAYVPQSRPLQVPLTVEELVLLGRYPFLSPFRLAPRATDFAAIERAMRLAGVEQIRGRALERLSGGERQSAYIAAALAQEAEVLILDEPTTHLDPRHQREVAGLILRLNRKEGLSVLVATHDLNLAALVADRVVALKSGEIIGVGSPEELLDSARLAEIFEAPFTTVRGGERPVTLLEIEP